MMILLMCAVGVQTHSLSAERGDRAFVEMCAVVVVLHFISFIVFMVVCLLKLKKRKACMYLYVPMHREEPVLNT